MQPPRFEEMSGVTGYLNRLMSRTMDGVVLFDDVGRIAFANAAVGRLIGMQPAQLVRHSFLRYVQEAERPTVLRRWRDLVAGREETYRVHLQAPGGGYRLVVIVQHRLAHDNRLHLAYVRDMAETAELSRQLHELHGLSSIAGAFANIADPRQVTDYLTRELAQLMGVEKCVISLYDPVTDMIEPQAPAHGVAEADLHLLRGRLSENGHFAQIVHSGQPRTSNNAAQDVLLNQRLVRHLQMRSILSVPLVTGTRTLGFVSVINRFGAEFHEDDVRPLQIFAGQVAVVLENARLVRELAQERSVALARAAQLEALLNSMVDGVFIVSADGRVTQVNAAALTLTGLGRDQALRPVLDYRDLLAPRDDEGQMLALEDLPWSRVVAGETVRHQEVLVQRLGGGEEVVLSMSGAPVRAPDGAIRLGIVLARDVTRLRALQREKDEFVSIATHELRTPLTSLRGYAQQVLRMITSGGEIDRERARLNLERVIRQVDRLTSLSADLTDFSQLETGHLALQPAPCDLVATVVEVLDRFKASGMAGPNRFVLVAPSHPLVGQWDAVRIEQVISNLIENAIKYSPAEGVIEVRLAQEHDQARLSVRDSGIGIAPDKVPRLFQRFYRVDSNDRRHGGLGLGLHIANDLVRLHGGTISVDSTPGVGSLFTVSLPLAGPRPVPAPAH
jgi:PAS domain S-box-containing protein